MPDDNALIQILTARLVQAEQQLHEQERILNAHRDAIAHMPRLQQDVEDALRMARVVSATLPAQAVQLERLVSDVAVLGVRIETQGVIVQHGRVTLASWKAYLLGGIAVGSTIVNLAVSWYRLTR